VPGPPFVLVEPASRRARRTTVPAGVVVPAGVGASAGVGLPAASGPAAAEGAVLAKVVADLADRVVDLTDPLVDVTDRALGTSSPPGAPDPTSARPVPATAVDGN
jgi:hypothetical protein